MRGGMGTGGRNRNPQGQGLGPGGVCVCPVCGHTQPHELGRSCMEMKCNECGARMTRRAG